MTSVTKIFRFEMGHAIDGYSGMCKYIHGHSYILHVTVTSRDANDDRPLPPPGFVIDFKDLKKILNEKVISQLDHSLILSEAYVRKHPHAAQGQNLLTWPYEPSAENILYFIRNEIQNALPAHFDVIRMKLWETADSFAEWEKN